MLSSHSSVIGLFLALAGGSLCPCHALRVRVTEDAGIVADEHHAEESPGDLAQPPETSENEKSGGYKAKEKPLSHLDRILETLNIEGYNFIVFLRNLQSLRSYMLHRNSKKLDKDKKRAFEYFGLNEDKSNSQSVSNNVLSLGATAISNMIKQL